MKTVIRPETEMKDSGIEWVENIPKNWRLRKINSLFETIGSGTTPNSNIEEYYQGMVNWLQSGDINGTIVKSTKKHISNEIISSTSALTVYKAPFIVIAMYGASIGNISMVDIDACTNQACCALVKPIKDIDMQYAFWGLMAAKEELVLSSRGGGQPNISQNIIKQLRVPVPYLQEQQAIADYLDETCSKIDEIIAEAKASIDEYKGLKQSVIFEAVTKGLDKNVEFIDSGDEWLGKYPKSYNIGQLSMLSNIVRGGSPRPAGDPRYYGGNISFMRISDITRDDNIYVISCENTITEEGLTRTRMIPPNTLLLTNSGATLGVPKINTFKTAFNDGIAAFLDLDKRLNIVYVYFFLKARTSYFLECASMGMGQPNLNTDIIGRTKIVFPTLVEQQKIVLYLEDRCGKLNSLIAEKESLINDLEAYKKSLIYEVVTGKRRVV